MPHRLDQGQVFKRAGTQRQPKPSRIELQSQTAFQKSFQTHNTNRDHKPSKYNDEFVNCSRHVRVLETETNVVHIAQICSQAVAVPFERVCDFGLEKLWMILARKLIYYGKRSSESARAEGTHSSVGTSERKGRVG